MKCEDLLRFLFTFLSQTKQSIIGENNQQINDENNH